MSEDNIPKRFREKIQEARKKNLEILDLRYEYGFPPLTKIPEEVFEIKQIKVLKLSHNEIKTIPDSIVNLSNLSELDLSFNKLTELPECIGNLSNLTTLDLSFNKLTKLP
ncbi:MAG: GTPase, partial [Moorea sp. SIO3C2]|nr:GTPase [Moorena sp. SIO3C2]